MKKFLPLFAVVAAALPLHAQVGCTNSPENPTIVLALIGTAGAFLASARRRFTKR